MVNKMSTKICKTKSFKIIINNDSSYPPAFCSPAGQRERWRLLTTWGSEPRPAARPSVSWRSKWHRPKMSAVWSELEGPPPRRSPDCSLVERAESRKTEVRRTFLQKRPRGERGIKKKKYGRTVEEARILKSQSSGWLANRANTSCAFMWKVSF